VATRDITPAEPRRSLIRHPDFVKLWTAESISQFGTQVSLLALPLIAALILRVTPFEFGLLGTIEFLPFILISLPAGVWVDRLPRRPILIVGDLGRAIALASIPVAFALGVLTIWQLYVVGFVTGCLTVFFDVAYQSYLPALVDRDDLVEGNSKLEISRSAAQLSGPGAAGLIIGAFTAPVAIVLDSLSFVASALFIFLIRKREAPRRREVQAETGKRTSMRQEIAEGLRYVLSHPHLRAIAACTGSSNLFSNLVFSILILYLVRDLAFEAEQIGIAFSIGAVGFLLGALTANRISGRLGVGPTIIVSAALFGPALILVPLAPAGQELAFVAAAGFITSFSTAVYNITQVSYRQAITPQRMQGRMNATMRFIVWGTIPIGTTLAGFLGGVIGLTQTIWIGVIGSMFIFLPVLLSPVRSLRKMPEPVDEQEPGEGEASAAIETLGDAIDESPRPVRGSPSPDDP